MDGSESEGDVVDGLSPAELARRVDCEMHPEWVEDDAEIDYIKPDSIFEPPLLTQSNGWWKWCCRRDCGRQTVYYVEDSLSDAMSSEKHSWSLFCASCGHQVFWEDVLFIHRYWYNRQMGDGVPSKCFGLLRDLWLHPEWVVDVGGLPEDDDAVRELIQRSWYEKEARYRLSEPMV